MKNLAPERSRAWVLGVCESGLSAVRSLGRAGVPVTGVDFNPLELGRYSRFGEFELSPSPVEDPQALLDWLAERGGRSPRKGVLLPATDAFAGFVSQYRDALAPYFLFALPPAPIMEALLDKYRHYLLAVEMGEKMPYTALIDRQADLSAVSQRLAYPAYIKACQTHLWKRVYPNKGFCVSTPQEFIQTSREILAHDLTAVAQPIIQAPVTNHYEVNFYRSVQAGHPILAVFPVRKVRQYPSGLGCGSLVESYDNPVVVARTLRFAENIDFQGIGNIEYIFDEGSQEYYLVELNARLWQQAAQADYCGMNFPLAAYRDLLGESQPEALTARRGARWLDLISDCRSAWQAIKAGDLGVAGWLGSLRGVNLLATFAWDDWSPSIHQLGYILKYLFSSIPLFRRRESGHH